MTKSSPKKTLSPNQKSEPTESFNPFDYKIATTLALYTTYNMYYMYKNINRADLVQKKIDHFSSEHISKAFETFNTCFRAALEAMKDATNKRSIFDELYNSWENTPGILDTLQLVSDNSNVFTQENNAPIILKEAFYAKAAGSISYRDLLPNIPDKEILKNFIKEAASHKISAMFGGALLIVEGAVSNFSFSDNAIYEASKDLISMFYGESTNHNDAL